MASMHIDGIEVRVDYEADGDRFAGHAELGPGALRDGREMAERTFRFFGRSPAELRESFRAGRAELDGARASAAVPIA
jgi:hypothetical protein